MSFFIARPAPAPVIIDPSPNPKAVKSNDLLAVTWIIAHPKKTSAPEAVKALIGQNVLLSGSVNQSSNIFFIGWCSVPYP